MRRIFKILLWAMFLVVIGIIIKKWGDWNAVAANASIFTAIVAILALLKSDETSRFCTGADLLTRLEERFTNKEMKEKRKNAATAIQAGYYKDESVWVILDFFSIIAILAHKDALDKELIWRTFSSWLIPYYFSLEKCIKLERKENNDPRLYESLSNLYYALIKFETRESLSKLTSQEKINKFFKEEIEGIY